MDTDPHFFARPKPKSEENSSVFQYNYGKNVCTCTYTAKTKILSFEFQNEFIYLCLSNVQICSFFYCKIILPVSFFPLRLFKASPHLPQIFYSAAIQWHCGVTLTKWKAYFGNLHCLYILIYNLEYHLIYITLTSYTYIYILIICKRRI